MKRRDFVTGAITGAVVGAGATILAKSTTLQPGTPTNQENHRLSLEASTNGKW